VRVHLAFKFKDFISELIIHLLSIQVYLKRVNVQDTGLLDKLRSFKQVMTEPRASNNENFDDVLRQYYDVIRQCSEQGLL